MTENMQTALTALRAHVEGVTETRADGSQWRPVCLDNAKPKGMGGKAWAATLGALEKAGDYEPEADSDFEDFFGWVRLA